MALSSHRFGWIAALVALWMLALAGEARAEWQLRPFLGATFAGDTTFVDLEHAAGKPNLAMGLSGGLLGDIFGIDGDLGYAPGFFETGDQSLVKSSNVTTLTGNIVVALPRRLAQYTLRPYFVTGIGVAHVGITNALDVLGVSANLLATDVGGGATGYLTDRVGLNWEVRRFTTRSKKAEIVGISFGPEDLSFWRATMGLAIRF